MAGEMFGPYRLEHLLGRGGMGEVWRAHDTRKDRDIALKVLGAWLGADPQFARRFRRESALACRLNAPNIVPIHDYGEHNGRLFIEMPLITGTDLGELVKQQGPLLAERAVAIITQVGRALSTAHQAGLVHRDVKPSNVLVTDLDGDDHVYLIDFGIAHSLDGSRISLSGSAIGTPAYMAPERFAGDGDHRGDIYALGCVLHEALTQSPPYAGTSPLVLMYAHLSTDPPRPSAQRPDIPAALDEVVGRAMAKDPDQRYQSATELTTAARTALTALTPPVEPRETPQLNPEPTGPGRAPSRVADAGWEVAPGTTLVPPTPPAARTPIPVEVTPIPEPEPTRSGPVSPERPGAGPPASSGPRRGSFPDTGRLPVAGLASTFVPPKDPAAPDPTEASSGHALRTRRRTAWAVAALFLIVTVGAGIALLTTTSPVTATIPVGRNPEGVGVSPDGRRVYVTNTGADSGSVSVIDAGSAAATVTIPVGSNPGSVGVSPDGRGVYVTNTGADSVSVIDAGSAEVTATIPVGDTPQDVGVSPDGRRVYVTNYWGHSVSVIDTGSNTVTATIPVGGTPEDVGVSPDGRRLYVANHDVGSVSVIDTGSNSVSATIPVGSIPVGVDVSPDGRYVYVTNYGADSVSVIDVGSAAVTATVPVGDKPEDVVVSPDGRRVYVANAGADSVSVIDTGSAAVTATVSVDSAPYGVGVSPDGRRVYVTNYGGDSDSVSVIDTGLV